MKTRTNVFLAFLLGATVITIVAWRPSAKPVAKSTAVAPLNGRYLFAAVPGVRDYLGYGGHGLLVFDIDHGHRFVKRIQFNGYHLDKQGKTTDKPSNVKGIGVSIPLHSVYITTLETLERIDLITGKLIWEKLIEHGCDRLSVSPDGKNMYLPSLES